MYILIEIYRWKTKLCRTILTLTFTLSLVRENNILNFPLLNHNHSHQIIVIETTFFVNIYRDWGKTLWEYYSLLGSTTNRFLKLKNLFFIRLQTSSRTCLTRISAKMITVSWSTNWSIERRKLGAISWLIHQLVLG